MQKHFLLMLKIGWEIHRKYHVWTRENKDFKNLFDVFNPFLFFSLFFILSFSLHFSTFIFLACLVGFLKKVFNLYVKLQSLVDVLFFQDGWTFLWPLFRIQMISFGIFDITWYIWVLCQVYLWFNLSSEYTFFS